MGEESNQRRSPEEYDAVLAEISREMDDELARGGPVGPGGTDDRVPGGEGSGGVGSGAGAGTGSVAGHWALAGLILLAVLAVVAALGIYVNFPVALLAGVVLTGLVIYVATQTGYRGGQGWDTAADIPLGLGAMLAVVSLSYFAPIFYLSGAGKEGVTTAVFVSHGSRGSVTCHAMLPNGGTAKVACLNPGDASRLSAGHYRVVYDPDGHTAAWTGTKSDLPVALGGALIAGGLVVCGIGAGLGIARGARGGSGRRPGIAG